MNTGEFPKKSFNESLEVTKKIKTNMKPFIEQFSKNNMLWIFQSISILFQNLTNPSINPLIKMNSMFAVKCIIDSCQYVPLALIEAYILPVIVRGASFDPTLEGQTRGLKFFSSHAQPVENIQGIGFNYVKLCTEIIRALAVIKPKKLYYNDFTSDKSQFSQYFEENKRILKEPSQNYVFFKQDPAILHKLYMKKLQQFDKDSQVYSKFVQQKFFEQIKTGFANQILDIRQLIKSGDMYICDDALQVAGNAVSQGKSCNLIKHALTFINSMVISGNYTVKVFLYQNQGIKNLVKGVLNAQTQSKKLDRGEHFIPDKKGTVQQRKGLYIQFLRCLQLWANTYIKNSLINQSSLSRVSKYYKVLKDDFKLEFPTNPNSSRQLKQIQENLRRSKNRNQLVRQSILQQVKQQQRQDSIIKAKIKSEQKVESSHSSIPKQSQKQIPPSKSKIPEQKIEATPVGSEGNQCDMLIRRAEKSLSNLTQNQKQLPNNINALQRDLKLIEKNLQQAVISDDQLQILMTKYLQIQQKYENIKPAYQNYKVNKIDYKTFCKMVDPSSRSSKLISSSNVQQNSKKQVKSEQIKEQIKKESSHSQAIIDSIPQQIAKNSLKNIIKNEASVSNSGIGQPPLNIPPNIPYQPPMIVQPGQYDTKIQNNEKIRKETTKQFIIGSHPGPNNAQVQNTQAINLKTGYIQAQTGLYNNVELQKNQIIVPVTNQNFTNEKIIPPPKIQRAMPQQNFQSPQRVDFQNSDIYSSRYTNTELKSATNLNQAHDLLNNNANVQRVPTIKITNQQHQSFQTKIKTQEYNIKPKVAENLFKKNPQKETDFVPQVNRRKTSGDFILTEPDLRPEIVMPQSQYKPSYRGLDKIGQRGNENSYRGIDKIGQRGNENLPYMNQSSNKNGTKNFSNHPQEIVTYQIKENNIPQVVTYTTQPYNKNINIRQQELVSYEPVTYHKQQNGINRFNEIGLSPIKRQLNQSHIGLAKESQDEMIVALNDNEFIQGPSLNPLKNSYHDFSQLQNKTKKTKTFRDVINSQSLFIKTNKKQNMFWLQSQSNSLLRPVNNSQKKSRIQSRINVPQLLQQRGKKYQMQMKLLQKNKNREIRELENKLNMAQRQKSILSMEVKLKENQIRSIKESSEAEAVKSKIDSYSLIDDQNYLIKKMANNYNYSNTKKLNDHVIANLKNNQSRIIKKGVLIDTNFFHDYLININDQKSKRIQFKNKQLLFKDKELQIGYMGVFQNNQYRVNCFITPVKDTTLQFIDFKLDSNLQIQHNFQVGQRFFQNKQDKRFFKINIVQIPYLIPQVVLIFRFEHSQKNIRFTLPCAFHKFIEIKKIDQAIINSEMLQKNTIRGQQIPYNKKILRNPDLLQDYLPFIEKLNRGEPNELGELCFGGEGNFLKTKFYVKISIKPNQFLYIQVKQPWSLEDRKVVDYYVATLNHLLMKQLR